MHIIESKNNNRIKEIKKLKERKWRKKEGKFLVEGYRFVQEACSSDFRVETIIINADNKDKYDEFKIKNNFSVEDEIYVSQGVYKEVAQTQNSQGIIAVVKNKSIQYDIEDGVYVLLDRLQDPGNVGTVIRTSHAAGVKGIVLTKGCVDIYNDKVLRSTMGSIFRVPIIDDSDLEFTKRLKESGYKFVVSSLEESEDFYDCYLKGNTVIAVGNEGSGLSQEIYNLQDVRVKIPMPGGAESLNAGVAASIMIYEYVRQQNNN
ncbi:TrmH family RNA methyltransferase [Oceanirhabdus sp. W0125-5]|uniref:TrmH family RNA methyltransferase n=1 Tax=Oceanirhabdus sp. W0125-5 TaxID=2999116 RepID=UPI0022F2B190|nr:RNA methyltransferase [Oceanirhabdus sp. W0125-5]WBW99408.1 RNA methyltransferase [Oceanirhabdus sp. W0125-5]